MTPRGPFSALHNISLKIEKGELLAVTGKSGSGKSTLLNMLTGIDKPTSGTVNIAGVVVEQLGENELASWRGKNIGIVFQFFQLIPTLTIVENVMLPMDFCKTYPRTQRRARALKLLEQVGIKDQADKLPATLSGGQQQRASVARALANDPPVLMADEPTGNLDSQNARAILQLLTELATDGKTIVVVTHEKEFARYFKKTIMLADGCIKEPNGKSDSTEVKHVPAL